MHATHTELVPRHTDSYTRRPTDAFTYATHTGARTMHKPKQSKLPQRKLKQVDSLQEEEEEDFVDLEEREKLGAKMRKRMEESGFGTLLRYVRQKDCLCHGHGRGHSHGTFYFGNQQKEESPNPSHATSEKRNFGCFSY